MDLETLLDGVKEELSRVLSFPIEFLESEADTEAGILSLGVQCNLPNSRPLRIAFMLAFEDGERLPDPRHVVQVILAVLMQNGIVQRRHSPADKALLN